MKRPAEACAREIEDDLKRAGVPVLLSLRDAAELTGKSVDLLSRLARDGILRATRAGTARGRTGHWRITRRELAVYLTGGHLEEVEP